jgi:hypothetical protein
MKLFNIFKKETSKEAKSTIQKMDKNQLSKVIGGDGGDTIDLVKDKSVKVSASQNSQTL